MVSPTPATLQRIDDAEHIATAKPDEGRRSHRQGHRQVPRGEPHDVVQVPHRGRARLDQGQRSRLDTASMVSGHGDRNHSHLPGLRRRRLPRCLNGVRPRGPESAPARYPRTRNRTGLNGVRPQGPESVVAGSHMWPGTAASIVSGHSDRNQVIRQHNKYRPHILLVVSCSLL